MGGGLGATSLGIFSEIFMKTFCSFLLILFLLDLTNTFCQTKEDTLKTTTLSYLRLFQKGDVAGSFDYVHTKSLDQFKNQVLSSPYFKSEWENNLSDIKYDSLVTLPSREFLNLIMPSLDINSPDVIDFEINIIGILYQKSFAYVVYESQTLNELSEKKDYVDVLKFERDNSDWKIIK